MIDREIEVYSKDHELVTQQIAIIQKDKISLVNPLTGIVQQTIDITDASHSDFILIQLKSNA